MIYTKSIYIYIYIYTHICIHTCGIDTYSFGRIQTTSHAAAAVHVTAAAKVRGWRNAVGSLVEMSSLQKASRGPRFTGTRVTTNREVQLHRLRDFDPPEGSKKPHRTGRTEPNRTVKCSD